MTREERKKLGLTLARKAHRCDLCGQVIEIGEAYRSHSCGPWDNSCDEAQAVHNCRFCDDIFAEETEGWDRYDFDGGVLSSDILQEAISDRQAEWGVAEFLDLIEEWERMTTAAFKRLPASLGDAPDWVYEWINKPRPVFGVDL